MKTEPQHSLAFSFLMHLLPGIAILAVYVGIAPTFVDEGFRAELALNLSFLIAGVPLPLAYLYYLGKRTTGGWSLDGIVLYRTKIPVGQYWQILVAFVLFASYLILISNLTNGIPAYIRSTFMRDFPDWFVNPYRLSELQPSDRVLMLTLIARLVLDGIIHPIVEELYFRGYLMPRLSRFNAWCPVWCALFFAMFHLWQPQNIPVIFLSVLPWMYLVWWKRNVYLSILIHCLGNSIGASIALIEFVTSS